MKLPCSETRQKGHTKYKCGCTNWSMKKLHVTIIHSNVQVCSGELLLSALKSTCNVPFIFILNLKVKPSGKSVRETKPFFLISYKFYSIHLHSDI
jgi:hypothetical protein